MCGRGVLPVACGVRSAGADLTLLAATRRRLEHLLDDTRQSVGNRQGLYSSVSCVFLRMISSRAATRELDKRDERANQNTSSSEPGGSSEREKKLRKTEHQPQECEPLLVFFQPLRCHSLLLFLPESRTALPRSFLGQRKGKVPLGISTQTAT